MNDKKSLYSVCETDYYQNNGKYAKLFSFKIGIAIDFTFELIHADFSHMSRAKFYLYSTGNETHLYNLEEEMTGISILLVKTNTEYAFYVKGQYAGNSIKLFLNNLSQLNHVDFSSYEEFSKDGLSAGETQISITKPAKNNGKRVYLSSNNVQNGWHVNEGSYVVRDNVCFVNFNIADGTITGGTIIVSGLPYPQNNSSEPAVVFTGTYQMYGDDDKFYACQLRLDGNGNLKIGSVKGAKSLIAGFSYPVYQNQY